MKSIRNFHDIHSLASPGRWLATGLAVGALAVAGCSEGGDGGHSENKASTEKKAASTAPSGESKPASKGEEVAKDAEKKSTEAVRIQVGDSIKYSKDKIEVAAGSEVKLTIEHTGKLPASAMGHNFVLLKKGTDMNKFATAAMSATQTGYIPEGMKDQVIAHTQVVGGGESDTITFDAPEKGEYIFLCSFPGHASQMNGKFIVK